MINFVCVLKSGGDFDITHVDRLCTGVRTYLSGDTAMNFYCLSDYEFDVRYITRVPLKLKLPGWWSMLEMFRIPPPAIYFDLDTTVVGSLEPLVEVVHNLPPKKVMGLRPWNQRDRLHGLMATGVTAWNTPLDWLTEKLVTAKANGYMQIIPGRGRKFGYMSFHGKKYRSDQHWTSIQLRQHRYQLSALQSVLPGFAQSYKADLKKGRLRPSGSLVIYHGHPRPWTPVTQNEEETKNPYEVTFRIQSQ